MGFVGNAKAWADFVIMSFKGQMKQRTSWSLFPSGMEFFGASKIPGPS